MSQDMYLKNVGRRARLKEELQALETKIKSHLESLQLRADPLENLDNLDGNAIASLGVSIGDLLIERRGKQQELHAVNQALGR